MSHSALLSGSALVYSEQLLRRITMYKNVLCIALRYSILSGNERMTFVMDPGTGVLSLSNKRRQGMKLSYQLNVSVSDGVFTNTAQVETAPYIRSHQPMCSRR